MAIYTQKKTQKYYEYNIYIYSHSNQAQGKKKAESEIEIYTKNQNMHDVSVSYIINRITTNRPSEKYPFG